MVRTGIVILSLCALALAGCNKSEYARSTVPTEAPAPAPMSGLVQSKPDVPDAMGRGGAERERQLMAYSHSTWLVSEPDTVLAHFERARDRCLNEAALNCILVSGSANAGDVSAQQAPAAQLIVTLPHDQVALFEKALRAALPGHASDIVVRSQNVEAENVTQEVVDIDRRIAQLTSYRDRLTAIAERSSIKASDLIELEEKISELQSSLDQLAAQKSTVGDRVKRERVSISFTARTTVSETARPLARAWDSSFQVLGESASAVLLILVAALPWIPVAGLIWFLVWLVRRNRRRNAPPPQATQAAPERSTG